MNVVYAAALALVASGCSFLRPARVPMHTVSYAAPAGPARAVLLLLPGFGDRDVTFAERGFVAAVQEAAPQLDIVAADAHFGYYRGRTLLVRLEADVLVGLRAKYSAIYIAGASMGGHGAVALARSHPEGVRGLLLFAPYFGPKDVVAEVKAAGGLCRYAPPLPLTEDSAGFARKNYVWLRDTACKPAEVAIFTAVGSDDSLAPAVAELARALPAEHNLVLEGGHGWKVWTKAAGILAARTNVHIGLTPSSAGH